jgi:superfamily II DNA or RNA helicase
MKSIKYPHAGTINIAPGNSNIRLYKHQNDAIQNLNDKILHDEKSSYVGLLVLPTGSGKTLTATYWLLKNYTDRNKKILWIAHRHELLEQAKNSFVQLAYSDILKNRTSFNYRIISGLHDKPVNIKPTDDIIIASKDSLNRGFKHLYNNLLKYNKDEIFLVIDEAHHATAKTYRNLIKNIKNEIKEFKMMGLTATPFRTAEKEQGLLLKVFPDDIIYKIDLRTLINRGILSKPIFEEEKTSIDMTKILNEKEIDNIKFFDIDSIGKITAKTIAENSERNHCIVDHYVNNRSKYDKTLVFALNIDNAIALNTLFNENGVKSDYVVSTIKDSVTGVTISNKLNKEKIENFRNGDLEVLVNVNILTEGTDLPETKTIFLARPTISSILMTQMVGRGLRGVKAGGTENAYIVGFIDDWKNKVAWVNPEKLFIEENTDFNDITPDTEKKLMRLVSIQKIEEFASLMDQSINTDELESLEFIERIPVGLYSFSILESLDGEEREKNCEILVYDNIKQSYEDLINALPDLFSEKDLSNEETLDEITLNKLFSEIENKFFYGTEKYPGYIPDDIKDILLFFAQKGVEPDFIELKDREKYDLTKLAREIYDEDMGERSEKKFLDENWDEAESKWKVFFGFDKKFFLNEIDLILRKLKFPELYQTNPNLPKTEHEKRELEKLSMSELREYCPEYWKKMSDSVYNKFKDENGYYYSAISGFKSKNRLKFQIDHIIPFSEGGVTKLDNLQLLTRQENMEKGNKIDSSANNCVSGDKKKIPLAYEKLWKKYKRNTKLLTEEEKEQLARYMKQYGLLN